MANKSTYVIDVKTKGAKKSEKQVKGVNKSLGALAKQAGLAAAAYFGTRGLINAFTSAIDKAGEQELAEKKLEASLGRTSQALLSQAAALQRFSMFGDEAIIEAQALIAAFVDDEEAIKLATQATLDLAAAKGMDLTAAADLVSKTLGSSTNAMSRYGIEVTGAVGSTERLHTLTGNIADRFGGQASEQADTYKGRVAQLSNAFGDLQETLGSMVTDDLKGWAESATGFFETINTKLELSQSEARVTSAAFELMGLEAQKAGIQQHLALKEMELELAKNPTLWGRAIDAIVEYSDEIMDAGIAIGKTLIPGWLLMEDVVNRASSAIENNSDFVKVNEEEVKKIVAQQEEWQVKLDAINESIAKNTETTEKNVKGKKQLTKAELDAIKAEKESLAMNKQIAQSAVQQGMSYKNTGLAAQEAASQVLIAKAQEAVAGYIAEALVKFPFPLNIALAAGAGAAVGSLMQGAVGQMKKIKFAQYGMNEVVDSPTLIMAGESGAEQVNITPLEGENRAGGSAGGNITFNNPIMTKDFVEGELAEAIRTASRQGVDFGV